MMIPGAARDGDEPRTGEMIRMSDPAEQDAPIDGLADSLRGRLHRGESPILRTQHEEYRLVREVGRGRSGIVYEALHGSPGRRVALRLLDPARFGRPIHLGRFLMDSYALSQLRHPEIATVLDAGDHEGRPFYVMPFVAGPRLDRVLDDRRRLDAPADPADDARAIRRVAATLQHLHDRGVLHLDIRPANLAMGAGGEVWVMNLAMPAAGDADAMDGLRYHAPERTRGRLDQRSEVYALGLTLYEMLTLRPAFDAADREQLIRRITQDGPPPIRHLRPTLSRDLATIVETAIAPDPARRYPTAAALADDLGRWLGGEPIRARRPLAPIRLARWARRNLATAAVALLARR